jgi:tRNA(Ile)-lysidine synthase
MARRALGPATLQVVSAVAERSTNPLLVACSGGPDSLALAGAAAVVAKRSGRAVRAVVVDHGLQDGSAEVAAGVVAQLDSKLAMPAQVVSIQVDDAGSGPEASARTARYAALEAAAAAEEMILLGHTLDDQAETVLLGLARGSGTRSLAGMATARGRFVRPLLGLRREITKACCVELGLQPWTDPHNSDSRFTRVRVRQQVLPMLEAELGPGVAQALARTAALARADADFLDSLAAERLAALDPSALDCQVLAELPQALLGRLLRDWLRQQGAGDISAAQVAAVASLVTDWRGQRWVEVPGLRVSRIQRCLSAASARDHG